MFYDIASFPWWLLAVALIGVLVGWVTYADIPRGGWFEGWVKWAAIAFVIGLVVAVLKLLPGEAGLWLEIALLVMFLYIVGCFLGGWLKSMWPSSARPRAEQAAQDVAPKDSALVEADRLAAQVAAKAEQDRVAAEAAAKAEAERQAAAVQAEQDRLAAEAAAKAEAEHQAAAAPGRAGSPGRGSRGVKAEAERQAAAAQAEQDRLAAEAAAKAEAERQAAAAQAEQDRLAAEAAAKAEAERQAATAQAEQDRLAAEAAAKAEAEQQAAAAQAEQDRLAAEAAAKAEAEREAAAVHAEQDRLAAEAAAEAERDAAETSAEQDRPVVTTPDNRPPALAAPQGASDDLKLIRGIGPNNEKSLNGLGIYHFSQIAAWSPDHAVWIGRQMTFPGRIERESWIPQAKLLAAGLDTDHSAAVKSGAIRIDDSADAPMSEAEARSLAAGMPALIPTVEGEERHSGVRPLGLAAPRGGVADDLKLIKGIGKQNEGRLHGLGVWHFDQIAAWSPEND